VSVDVVRWLLCPIITFCVVNTLVAGVLTLVRFGKKNKLVMMKFKPRGKQCAKCTMRLNDCSSLAFENMPIYTKTPDFTTVTCTHFDKEEKMSNNLSGLNDILFD
jgi:hypothetical protein